MKTLFRILGTAAAVAVTGAAIVVLDKILNQKDPLHVEEVEFPEEDYFSKSAFYTATGKIYRSVFD